MTTLAELLQRIRYRTAAFIGYYLLGAETDLHRGFDTFQLDQVESHQHDRKSMYREVAGFRAAREWLEDWHQDTKGGAEPFFLWFHSQQIHQSYDPPAPYDALYLEVPRDVEVRGIDDFELRCFSDVRKAHQRGGLTSEMKAQVEALYDGEIRLVDDELGKIFGFLRRAGVYDDTVIVVVSDHGEHLFEETEVDFGWSGFLHGQTYFDSVVRVPLIIKPAASTTSEAGGRPAVTASTVDLFPTVIELLGLELPLALPGRSLVPWMVDPMKSDPVDAVYFQESPEETVWAGLRTAEWKFLRKQGEDGGTTRWLLNLRADPEERHDVYRANRAVARQLERRLDEWLSEQHAVTPSSLADMSERMRKALRDAGYLRDSDADSN